MERFYPLVAMAMIVMVSLLFVFSRMRRLKELGPAINPAQQRFARRVAMACPIGALALAAILLALPLSVTSWQLVAIAGVFCAVLIGVLLWAEQRMIALSGRLGT